MALIRSGKKSSAVPSTSGDILFYNTNDGFDVVNGSDTKSNLSGTTAVIVNCEGKSSVTTTFTGIFFAYDGSTLENIASDTSFDVSDYVYLLMRGTPTGYTLTVS